MNKEQNLILEGELLLLTAVINKCKEKLEENYLYNFGWGYAKELYCALFKKYSLEGCIEFVEANPDRAIEWLQHNIKAIENKLLNEDLTQNTSSLEWNLSYQYEKDCEQYLRKLYITVINS